MSINLIFANVGTGKTTLLAKLCKKELKRKKQRYAHIYCSEPIKGTYMFNPKDLGRLHYENDLILIDEGSIHFNNRLMSMTKAQIEFFKLHRHYKCDIWIVSQSYEDIDITLRRLYSSMYLMKRSIFPGFSYYKEIKKDIGISEDSQMAELYYFVPFSKKYFFRPKYYKLFDSYSAPSLANHTPILYDFN